MADSITSLPSDANTIFTLRPQWAREVSTQYISAKNVVRYPGTISDVLSFSDFIGANIGLQYTAMDKPEEKKLLDFFVARKGRYERFWCPGFRQEFVLTTALSEFSVGIRVTDNGFDHVHQGHERLYLLLDSGDMVVRKILAVHAGVYTGELLLQVDTSIGRDIALEEVLEFGRLYLVRFESDKLTFAHKCSQTAEVNLAVIELVESYPEADPESYASQTPWNITSVENLPDNGVTCQKGKEFFTDRELNLGTTTEVRVYDSELDGDLLDSAPATEGPTGPNSYAARRQDFSESDPNQSISGWMELVEAEPQRVSARVETYVQSCYWDFFIPENFENDGGKTTITIGDGEFEPLRTYRVRVYTKKYGGEITENPPGTPLDEVPATRLSATELEVLDEDLNVELYDDFEGYFEVYDDLGKMFTVRIFVEFTSTPKGEGEEEPPGGCDCNTCIPAGSIEIDKTDNHHEGEDGCGTDKPKEFGTYSTGCYKIEITGDSGGGNTFCRICVGGTHIGWITESFGNNKCFYGGGKISMYYATGAGPTSGKVYATIYDCSD